MSHESIEQRESTGERNRQPLPSGQYLDAVTNAVKTAAFWTAITLPFLYVPLLATGLQATPERLVFTGLLALNVLALVVGHSHKREA